MATIRMTAPLWNRRIGVLRLALPRLVIMIVAVMALLPQVALGQAVEVQAKPTGLTGTVAHNAVALT